jgi:oligopeptidase A
MKFTCVNTFVCMAFFSSSARAFSSALRRPTSNVCSRAMSTATATESNPLLQQDDLPKFSIINPEDLTPAVETLLEKMNADFASLEEKLAAASSSSIDYDTVLPEVERIQFPIGYAWGIAGHLNGVKNGDELRKAYEENQPKIVQAMSKFSQSKPLYDALSAIEKQWGEEKTDSSFEMQQRRRAVESSLQSMKLGGVGLEGQEKERFNEIKMRQASLSTTFSNNVLDETKAFAMTVGDVSMMAGVPDSAKSLWANAHAMNEKSNAAEGVEVPPMDAEKGPWRITLDMPSYMAVMLHMQDRSIREEIYKVYLTRASEMSKNEEKNNIPLIYEILQLKSEMAKVKSFGRPLFCLFLNKYYFCSRWSLTHLFFFFFLNSRVVADAGL